MICVLFGIVIVQLLRLPTIAIAQLKSFEAKVSWAGVCFILILIIYSSQSGLSVDRYGDMRGAVDYISEQAGEESVSIISSPTKTSLAYYVDQRDLDPVMSVGSWSEATFNECPEDSTPDLCIESVMNIDSDVVAVVSIAEMDWIFESTDGLLEELGYAHDNSERFDSKGDEVWIYRKANA